METKIVGRRLTPKTFVYQLTTKDGKFITQHSSKKSIEDLQAVLNDYSIEDIPNKLPWKIKRGIAIAFHMTAMEMYHNITA